MVVVRRHHPTKLVHFTHVGRIAQNLLVDTIVDEAQPLLFVCPVAFPFWGSLHPPVDHRLHVPSFGLDFVAQVIRHLSGDLFRDFSPVDLLDEGLADVGVDALVDEFLWINFVLQPRFLYKLVGERFEVQIVVIVTLEFDVETPLCEANLREDLAEATVFGLQIDVGGLQIVGAVIVQYS